MHLPTLSHRPHQFCYLISKSVAFGHWLKNMSKLLLRKFFSIHSLDTSKLVNVLLRCNASANAFAPPSPIVLSNQQKCGIWPLVEKYEQIAITQILQYSLT